MNMQALMQQAQKMQRDIEKKKDELNKKTFVGTSELVEVTFTGNKKLVSVSIKQDNLSDDDKEILETYAKYGVTVQSFTDEQNKNYYLEITSYVDKSLYFCFRFYIENNQLKKEKIEFESFSVIKNSLLNPWQDFPIRLLDNSQLEFYSKFIEFGKYETIFQISNNKKIIDVIQLLSEYEILSRPCINDKKNLLIFYGCPYENVEKNLVL